MADIYGIDSQLGGVFRGTKMTMSLATNGGQLPSGALVQGLRVQYQRQVNRFWSIGNTRQYYIEGRTEGQGEVSRIVGPEGLIDSLTASLADICNVKNNVLSFQGNEGDGAFCAFEDGTTPTATALHLGDVIATTMSMGVDAQQFVINASMGLMFTSLSRTAP